MTNNTTLLKLVYNGANPLAQRSAEVTGQMVSPETQVYYSKKGFFTCAKNKVEGWRLDRWMEFPDACPLDLIVRRAWRDSIVQVEVNLDGEYPLGHLLQKRTGPKSYMVGLGLEAFKPEVFTSKSGARTVMIDGTAIAYSVEPEHNLFTLSSFGLNEKKLVLSHILAVARGIVESSRQCSYSMALTHPDWVEVEKGEARYNLFLYRKVNEKTFTRIVFDRMGGLASAEDRAKAALRAGKDMLAEFIGDVVTKRVLIVADKYYQGNKDLMSNDGGFYLKEMDGLDAGEHGLVRGIYKNAEGHIGIVKGRVTVHAAVAAAHPDEDIILDHVDGWSREGQFKFASVKPGDVIEIQIGLVKDENYAEKDRYGLNTSALYIADMDEMSKDRLELGLLRKAKKVAYTFANMPSVLDDMLKNGLEDEESSAVVNGRMAKYALGYFGAFPDGRNDRWSTLVAQKASCFEDEHVVRASLSFAESIAFVEEVDGVRVRRVIEVPIDGFLASEGLAAKCAEYNDLPVMVLRYPVLTKTSFLTVEHAGTVPGFAGRFALLHPKAAAGLAGDDDDCGSFCFGYRSKVKPSTEIQSIEKHCVEVPLTDITAEAAYIWGYTSQSMVGAYTNALHESVLFGANPNEGNASVIAQAVQALVQGVKKPVVPGFTYAEAKRIAERYRKNAIGTMSRTEWIWRDSVWSVTKKTEKRSVKLAAIPTMNGWKDERGFNAQLAISNPVKRETIALDSVEKMFLGALFVKYFRSENAPSVSRLSRELIDTLVQYYDIDLATAEKKDFDRLAQVYAAFYDGVAAAPDSRTTSAFEHANGALLWWGNRVR